MNVTCDVKTLFYTFTQNHFDQKNPLSLQKLILVFINLVLKQDSISKKCHKDKDPI